MQDEVLEATDRKIRPPRSERLHTAGQIRTTADRIQAPGHPCLQEHVRDFRCLCRERSKSSSCAEENGYNARGDERGCELDPGAVGVLCGVEQCAVTSHVNFTRC